MAIPDTMNAATTLVEYLNSAKWEMKAKCILITSFIYESINEAKTILNRIKANSELQAESYLKDSGTICYSGANKYTSIHSIVFVTSYHYWTGKSQRIGFKTQYYQITTCFIYETKENKCNNCYMQDNMLVVRLLPG